MADAVFRNVYRLVDEYKVSNSYVVVEGTQNPSIQYPHYVIHNPEFTKTSRDFSSTAKKVSCTVLIELNALPVSGWKKHAEMYDALDAGIDTENANLKTARMRYLGSSDQSIQPIDVEGKQVFQRIIAFDFEILR